MESPTPRHGACYAVRVTIPMVPRSFWSAILLMCEALFVVQHPTDKNHYHLAIVNTSFTQDTLRKKLRAYTTQYFAESNQAVFDENRRQGLIGASALELVELPEGQGLLSCKKWDTAPKYLVYMLKGQYSPCFNENREGMWLHPDYITALLGAWVSRNPQETSYRLWQVSKYFPEPPTQAIMNNVGEVIIPAVKASFDTIINLARTFAMETEETEYVNPKVRFITKDLVSNYCLRHNIKMANIYI